MRIDKRIAGYTMLLSLCCLLILAGNLMAATLTVGSNAGMPGDSNIIIPVNLISAPSEKASGFNFDLKFDTSRLSFKEATIGPKSNDAGKSLSSSRPSNDVVRVIVIGFNQNTIENGVVLNFTFDILSSAPSGKTELTIIDPSISDPDGNLLSVTTENGEIDVGGDSSDSTTTTTEPVLTTTPTTAVTTTPATTSQLPVTTSLSTVKTSTTTTIEQPPPDTTTTIKELVSTTSSTSPSTTTSLSQLWEPLYDEMWQGKREQNLLLLRAFRDEVLLHTDVGREYVVMLYLNSIEIALLLIQNPSLTAQVGEVLNGMVGSIESLLYGDEMILRKEVVESLELLLTQLELHASPGLKAAIGKVREDMREGRIVRELGIVVTGQQSTL
jgi:hypothetical protein